MSSALVVLHIGLNDRSRHMQLNKMIRNKKTKGSDTVSEVALDNPVISFCVRMHKICYNTLAKSTYQQVIPQRTQQVEGFMHTRKSGKYFSRHQPLET